jgi:hypothetical protein
MAAEIALAGVLLFQIRKSIQRAALVSSLFGSWK